MSGNLAGYANATAVRAALDKALSAVQSAGIGSVVQAFDAATAKTNVVQEWTAEQTFGETKSKEHEITGTTPEIDPANGPVQYWTLTGNSTPTGALESGQFVLLFITHGSYTINWASLVDQWAGGIAPVPSTTGWNVLMLIKRGTDVFGAEVGKFA